MGLGLLALALWPYFLVPPFCQLIDHWMNEPPLRLGRPARAGLRVLAYAPPLLIPWAFQAGEATAGLLFLTGFPSLYGVLLLCQPGRLEGFALTILMFFWLFIALLPAMMMD
jgi:hypothetical protein